MSFQSIYKLKERIKKEKWIHPFHEDRIKQVAYELSLGDDYYLTDLKSHDENWFKSLLNKSKQNELVEINPGQFALLLTSEKITIPNDKIALISVKAGEKLKGLVNVSGFHVDPGFSGNLLFSVYNAGPSTITLRKGEQYFLLWFCELDEPIPKGKEYNGKSNSHQGQDKVPAIYMDALKRGKLAAPNVLLDRVNDLERKTRNYHRTLISIAAIAIPILFTLAFTFWQKWLESVEENASSGQKYNAHIRIDDELQMTKDIKGTIREVVQEELMRDDTKAPNEGQK